MQEKLEREERTDAQYEQELDQSVAFEAIHQQLQGEYWAEWPEGLFNNKIAF